MSIQSGPPIKIAILGTRGIPNQYGGFEQFAEYLATGLHQRGHEVAVYLPHFHPYKEDTFNGVRLHRVHSPERFLGAGANFLYDFLCLRDCIRRGYDIALECGYGTASISYLLFPFRKTRIITNMDGLEWKRSKWSPLVQRLTKWFEALAVRHSDILVSDNIGIQNYLMETYSVESSYIPYGADLVEPPSPAPLVRYQVESGHYYLAMARLEPENNLEMLIEGYRLASTNMPLLIIGNYNTPYGQLLRERGRDLPGIRFLGGIYDKPVIDALRHHASLYFHGHSVGGTNPSLLEAMGCGALIAAHNNPFNRDVIQNNAFYFSSADDIRQLIQVNPHPQAQAFREANLRRIDSTFSWPTIIHQYETLFRHSLHAGSLTCRSAP